MTNYMDHHMTEPKQETTSNSFIQEAIKTESPKYYPQNARIVHAALGLSTESGEILDLVKKALFYGKEIDRVNLKEETGDILWYLAILFDELETDFETEMARVIAKLKVRYPGKFSQAHALKRDLNKERKTLEKSYE